LSEYLYITPYMWFDFYYSCLFVPSLSSCHEKATWRYTLFYKNKRLIFFSKFKNNPSLSRTTKSQIL